MAKILANHIRIKCVTMQSDQYNQFYFERISGQNSKKKRAEKNLSTRLHRTKDNLSQANV